MEVFGGDLASTRYEAGTQAYADALQFDYESGLLTQDQYRTRATLQPGQVTPTMEGAEPTSAWTTFFEGIGSAATQLFSGYTKLQTMENQQTMLKLDVERQRLAMARGMIGEGEVPSYGGINVYTLAMFAGIGLFALILLKKK